jgi:hypothetical protein
MATIASPETDLLTRERRFFFAMSLALIAAALLGFGFFQYAGISSWGAPWWVHVHAVSQMGWLGFYALQNWLVVDGNVSLHRRLGVFGAFFGAWLVVIGMSLSVAVIVTGRSDGTFTPANLLALNGATMAAFAVLFVAAIARRKQSDWHKRLMLGALAALSLPSFGRILIMLDMSTTLNRVLLVLSVMACGVIFDLRTGRGIHPAYLWGAAVAAVMGLGIGGLPMFAPFADFANSLAN